MDCGVVLIVVKDEEMLSYYAWRLLTCCLLIETEVRSNDGEAWWCLTKPERSVCWRYASFLQSLLSVVFVRTGCASWWHNVCRNKIEEKSFIYHPCPLLNSVSSVWYHWHWLTDWSPPVHIIYVCTFMYKTIERCICITAQCRRRICVLLCNIFVAVFVLCNLLNSL